MSTVAEEYDWLAAEFEKLEASVEQRKLRAECALGHIGFALYQFEVADATCSHCGDSMSVILDYSRPLRLTKGTDGLPNYVSAQKGDPLAFRPPRQFRFIVYHHDVELRYVIEADRERGWAKCLHWEHYRKPDGSLGTRPKPDGNGEEQYRIYTGAITFRLVPRQRGIVQ